MHSNYKDIKNKIREEPKWYDANGVPRYDGFHPRYCPNIYSNQVVLLRIACQYCREEFNVELHRDWFEAWLRPDKLHYGDPPIHGCVGDTENCDDKEVLQVWVREDMEWKRLSELEGPIDEG